MVDLREISISFNSEGMFFPNPKFNIGGRHRRWGCWGRINIGAYRRGLDGGGGMSVDNLPNNKCFIDWRGYGEDS